MKKLLRDQPTSGDMVQRDGLRPGSPRGVMTASIMPATHRATPRGEIADANESLRTAASAGRTASVFGELKVQGELTRRAWAKGMLGSAGDPPQTFSSGLVPMHMIEENRGARAPRVFRATPSSVGLCGGNMVGGER